MNKTKILWITFVLMLSVVACIFIIWSIAQVALLFREKRFTGSKYEEQSLFNIPLSNPDNQMQLCELMAAVDQLFDKHELDYWIIAGTCLGAVRHKGMIPWDDDIDIGIMKDKESFLTSTHFKTDLDKLGLKLLKFPFFGYKIMPKNAPPIEAIRVFSPIYYPFVDIFIMKKSSTNKIEYDRKSAQISYPKEWFYEFEIFPTQRMDFGSFRFKGPRSPNNYLARSYGNDYATKACFSGRHGQLWYPQKCFQLNNTQKQVCGC